MSTPASGIGSVNPYLNTLSKTTNFSPLISADANAANLQVGSIGDANTAAQQGYTQQQQYLKQGATAGIGQLNPYTSVGQTANQNAAQIAGSGIGGAAAYSTMLANDPALQGILQQSNQQLQQQAAAQGGRFSGQAASDLLNNSINTINNYENTKFGQNETLAAQGLNAATTGAGISNNLGINQGNTAANAGTATANADIAKGTVLGNSLINQGQAQVAQSTVAGLVNPVNQSQPSGPNSVPAYNPNINPNPGGATIGSPNTTSSGVPSNAAANAAIQAAGGGSSGGGGVSGSTSSGSPFAGFGAGTGIGAALGGNNANSSGSYNIPAGQGIAPGSSTNFQNTFTGATGANGGYAGDPNAQPVTGGYISPTAGLGNGLDANGSPIPGADTGMSIAGGLTGLNGMIQPGIDTVASVPVGGGAPTDNAQQLGAAGIASLWQQYNDTLYGPSTSPEAKAAAMKKITDQITASSLAAGA